MPTRAAMLQAILVQKSLETAGGTSAYCWQSAVADRNPNPTPWASFGLGQRGRAGLWNRASLPELPQQLKETKRPLQQAVGTAQVLLACMQEPQALLAVDAAALRRFREQPAQPLCLETSPTVVQTATEEDPQLSVVAEPSHVVSKL